APMVWVRKVDLKADKRRHAALTWRNLDTGKLDSVATLYIDGVSQGEVKDRALAMDWDIERAGIYVAVNYIGLLDELAVFGRELTTGEVKMLHDQPGILAPLKK